MPMNPLDTDSDAAGAPTAAQAYSRSRSTALLGRRDEGLSGAAGAPGAGLETAHSGRPRLASATRSTLSEVRSPESDSGRSVATLPVSVVIPTWNEGENIAHVLADLPDVEQLIIVDACSDDGTVEIVREHRPDAIIVLQPASGKGNAVRAGLEVATARHIISMDADGSMDPKEIPGFVALLENGYDMVKGSRGAVGGGSTDFTPLRRAGNRGLVGLYNLMFRARLSDITFGYIGFRREVLPRLGLYATGFEIEVQMVTHAQLAGLRFAELPSREADRLNGESHLNTFKDGRRVLNTILRARTQPGREWWRHVGAGPLSYEVAPMPASHPESHPESHSESHSELNPAARRTPGIPQQRGSARS